MSIGPRNNRIDYIEFSAPTPEALAHARKIYGDAFSWEYKGWGPAYADTQDSGVPSGIGVSNQPPLPVIYFADLEDARSRVLKAGGTLVKDIFGFPGGRRFHFKDPAGNELAVWSDVQSGT
jgi:predicted enzyme related to lactoylglutathione lyase